MNKDKKNEIAMKCADRLGKRMLDTHRADGTATLWSQHMARVAMLDAIEEVDKEAEEGRAVLKAGLDTAIKCGDVQREKIKDLEKYRTNLIRALGSVMHECSKNKGQAGLLIGAIRKVVMNVLAPNTCQMCYQKESEFDAGPGVPVCKECWVDWWVDGLEPRDDEHRAQLKEETLENMAKQEHLEAANG